MSMLSTGPGEEEATGGVVNGAYPVKVLPQNSARRGVGYCGLLLKV